MKKFVTKGLIYFLGILLISTLLSGFGLWLVSKGNFYKPSFVVNGLPSKSFHTVVFGSSRGLAALDSKMISEAQGAPCLNLCMTDTALPTHFLMIKHFFEQGNSAEFVLLSVDLGDFEKSQVKTGDADFKFAPFAGEGYVQEFYQKYDQTGLRVLANSNWMPLLAYGFYNSQLIYPSLISAIRPSYKYLFDELGNYGYPDYLGLSELPAASPRATSLKNPILEEISQYVEQKGAKLIIYIAPYLQEDIRIEGASFQYIINHSRLLNEAKFFSDNIHLVNAGKISATKALNLELAKNKHQP
ncbi:hypothetical protein ACFOSV_07265 [Algoriphagus namhaensis]|uniref:SGNH/GDSL hydrolase family protein n=1 Tax=Algoriphagus namhaensis TaxID=915353 RepID=A0ABV8AQP8_9BACT